MSMLGLVVVHDEVGSAPSPARRPVHSQTMERRPPQTRVPWRSPGAERESRQGPFLAPPAESTWVSDSLTAANTIG
jgi:hypothetical protein